MENKEDLLHAYNELTTNYNGVNFTLKNAPRKSFFNRLSTRNTGNKSSNDHVIFNFDENSKQFNTDAPYKSIQTCNNVNKYPEISAKKYKLKKKDSDKKYMYVLLFYTRNGINSDEFKEFIYEYINKEFNVIIGFHDVNEKDNFFDDYTDSGKIFFKRPRDGLNGSFTYTQLETLYGGNKKIIIKNKNKQHKKINKRTRKNKNRKYQRKYKKSIKNKTKKI